MTHDTIRARIAEIENELFAPAAYNGAAILSTPSHRDRAKFDAYLQDRADRETRRQALIAERAELLLQLPPTGEQSGQRLVMHRILGPVRLDDWQPEPPRPDPNLDSDCPLRRAAAEFGWNFE